VDASINIAGLIILLVGNIIGWIYTIWKAGNVAAKERSKYEERLDNVIAIVKELPCKANPQFQINIGSVVQRFSEIDKGLDTLNKLVQDRIRSCEDDIRSLNLRMNNKS